MPKVKLKTKKAISSRFKLTAKGHLKYRKGGKRHLLAKKSSKHKRRLGKPSLLPPAKEKIYKTLISASM